MADRPFAMHANSQSGPTDAEALADEIVGTQAHPSNAALDLAARVRALGRELERERRFRIRLGSYRGQWETAAKHFKAKEDAERAAREQAEARNEQFEACRQAAEEARKKAENRATDLDCALTDEREQRKGWKARAVKAEAELRNRCDECGAKLYHGPPDCPRCGAPNCCPACCRITSAEAERDALREDVRVERELGTSAGVDAERAIDRADKAEAAERERQVDLDAQSKIVDALRRSLKSAATTLSVASEGAGMSDESVEVLRIEAESARAALAGGRADV